jgi:N-acetylglucosaminyldiphosphoundecaprenol N-acetyl-beta-D-mannosaminyltransferase
MGEMNAELDRVPIRDLLGVPVNAMTMENVLDRVDTTIAQRSRLLIGVVNAAKIVNMRRQPLLDEAVRSADVIVADGMSVVWASRLLRRPLPERVPGIDLMTRMLERGSAQNYRVFCLGAEQAVLDNVLDHIREHYPGVQLVGSHHGFFNESDEARIAGQIAEAAPDILFVAMTSPKKEDFLARNSAVVQVPVCHGVGGAFDVVAGKVRRAPQLWQKFGLEWLYRVVQEPRRMWRRYLVTNTLFCGMVLGEMFGLRRSASP